jgi:hypothetical protein
VFRQDGYVEGARRNIACDQRGDAERAHDLAISQGSDAFTTLSREADSAQECVETGVGPQGIPRRAQQDGGIETGFIGLIQPDHRLVMLSEPDIDQGDIGVRRGIAIMPGL